MKTNTAIIIALFMVSKVIVVPNFVEGSSTTISEYISNVTCGTINQTSGFGPAGYQDFTSQSTNIQIDETLSATITVSNPKSSDQILIWVDWNKDGDFNDMGENVYSSSGSFTSPHITPNFAPPVGAAYGSTRIRIRLHDQSCGPVMSPCGNSTWGEVEDYTINVLCIPPVAPSVGSITQPTCSNVTGSVVLNGLPATGNWLITRTPGDITTLGSGVSTTVSWLDPGNYTYKVTNSTGCTSPLSANIAINPQPVPPAPTGPSTQSFFSGATVADLNASGIAIQWYESLASGYPLDPSVPLTAKHYFASQTVNGCESYARLNVSVSIIPCGQMNPVSDIVVCNGSLTPAVIFTSQTTGWTPSYTWTNTGASIGLAVSGSGNIPSFNAINTNSVPVASLITVTPSFNNGATICMGNPITFSIIVNPAGQVNQPSNEVVLSGNITNPIVFSTSISGGITTYQWANNNPSIGLFGSGSGNILPFQAVNSQAVPIVATILVEPQFTNAGVTCPGPEKSFTITVNPVPPTSITALILSGMIRCYNSTQTITVAGDTSTFIIQPGGSATFIAGQNIRFLQGTTVQSGGYMWGYIAPNGPFCQNPSIPSLPESKGSLPISDELSSIKIYPNPTKENFILEINSARSDGQISVEVYGKCGQRVFSEILNGEARHEFSLIDRPAGMYFIRVVASEWTETMKIIKK